MGDYPEFPPAFVLRDPQGVRDFGSDTLEDLVHAVVLLVPAVSFRFLPFRFLPDRAAAWLSAIVLDAEILPDDVRSYLVSFSQTSAGPP